MSARRILCSRVGPAAALGVAFVLGGATFSAVQIAGASNPGVTYHACLLKGVLSKVGGASPTNVGTGEYCLIADATSTEANTSLLLSPGGPGGAGAGVAAWTGYCNYSPLGLEVETFTLSGAASNSIAFEAVIPSTP